MVCAQRWRLRRSVCTSYGKKKKHQRGSTRRNNSWFFLFGYCWEKVRLTETVFMFCVCRALDRRDNKTLTLACIQQSLAYAQQIEVNSCFPLCVWLKRNNLKLYGAPCGASAFNWVRLWENYMIVTMFISGVASHSYNNWVHIALTTAHIDVSRGLMRFYRNMARPKTTNTTNFFTTYVVTPNATNNTNNNKNN